MQLMKIFSSYGGVSKEAKYLIYASILPSVAFGLIFTDIAYFLTAVQDVSADFTGIVISSMGISTFVASLFLGIAADVYGRKKLLIIGNVLASLILIVFALTTNPLLLMGAAILEGIAEAAIFASSSALLADKVIAEERTSAFSLYGFVQSFAFGIGSFAIPAVLIFELLGFTNKESHIILYVLISILSLISTLIILKVSESVRLKKNVRSYSDLLPKKSRKVLLKYVFTGALLAFGAGMVVPLMTLWFNLQYGISDAISAPILGVSSLLIALAILVAPLLAKRYGLVKAIVVTQIASTVFMFATPLSPNYVLAGFVYSTRALLMNMASPLSQSMIMGLVAEDERGAASGISGALWRLPNALSTFIGAWLMGMGFLAEPFFMASIFYIISIMLFWLYFRKVEMPEEQTLRIKQNVLK
jgi:MFS family permease